MDDKEFYRLVGSMDLTRPKAVDLYYIFKAEAGTLGFSHKEWKLLKQTFWFTVFAHRRTPRRSSGEAYLLHPYRMALTAIRDQKRIGIRNVRIVQYCLLHDTIEEAVASGLPPATLLSAIEILFGRECRDNTALLTKDGDDAMYWLMLLTSHAWEVPITKGYDRHHNLLTLAALPRERQIAKIKETETYIWRLITRVRELVGVYCHDDFNTIQKYNELLSLLASRIRDAINERQAALDQP